MHTTHQEHAILTRWLTAGKNSSLIWTISLMWQNFIP